MIAAILVSLGVVFCGTILTCFVMYFRALKELEAMRTAREVGLAKVGADSAKLAERVEKLAKDVKDLSTPERVQVVNELAKKFKMGLGVHG